MRTAIIVFRAWLPLIYLA